MTPAIYASSTGVKRHFCATCGTPMAYESRRWPDEIHFYATSLDDPAAFQPTEHVNWNERLPWLHLADGLPVRRTPRQLGPDEDASAVLALLRAAFAYMDALIDPPSSLHLLDAAGVSHQAKTGEVWVIEEQGAPIACVFLTPEAKQLYVGKMAVADGYREKGLGRQLVGLAEARAKALGLPELTLKSRVELTGNHTAFIAMGFSKIAETAHEGYNRPTSFTFSKKMPKA